MREIITLDGDQAADESKCHDCVAQSNESIHTKKLKKKIIKRKSLNDDPGQVEENGGKVEDKAKVIKIAVVGSEDDYIYYLKS